MSSIYSVFNKTLVSFVFIFCLFITSAYAASGTGYLYITLNPQSITAFNSEADAKTYTCSNLRKIFYWKTKQWETKSIFFNLLLSTSTAGSGHSLTSSTTSETFTLWPIGSKKYPTKFKGVPTISGIQTYGGTIMQFTISFPEIYTRQTFHSTTSNKLFCHDLDRVLKHMVIPKSTRISSMTLSPRNDDSRNIFATSDGTLMYLTSFSNCTSDGNLKARCAFTYSTTPPTSSQ